MIWTPNRLAGVVEQLERGEPVDTGRLSALQALDLVIAGREFVQAAVLQNEAEDERIAADIRAAAGL